jgi:hypothetical protein
MAALAAIVVFRVVFFFDAASKKLLDTQVSIHLQVPRAFTGAALRAFLPGRDGDASKRSQTSGMEP